MADSATTLYWEHLLVTYKGKNKRDYYYVEGYYSGLIDRAPVPRDVATDFDAWFLGYRDAKGDWG